MNAVKRIGAILIVLSAAATVVTVVIAAVVTVVRWIGDDPPDAGPPATTTGPPTTTEPPATTIAVPSTTTTEPPTTTTGPTTTTKPPPTTTDPPAATTEPPRVVPAFGDAVGFVDELKAAGATVVEFIRPSVEAEQGLVIDVEPSIGTPIDDADLVRVVVSTGEPSDAYRSMARNGGVYVELDLTGPSASLIDISAAEEALARLFQKLGLPGRQLYVIDTNSSSESPPTDAVVIGIDREPGPGYLPRRIHASSGTVALFFEDEPVLNNELVLAVAAAQDDVQRFALDDPVLEWSGG